MVHTSCPLALSLVVVVIRLSQHWVIVVSRDSSSLSLSLSGPGPASRSSYACCLSALVVTLGLFLWETKNFQTAMLLVLALSFATGLFATPSMNLTHALPWVLYRESSPWDLDHRYLSTLRWLSSRLA